MKKDNKKSDADINYYKVIDETTKNDYTDEYTLASKLLVDAKNFLNYLENYVSLDNDIKKRIRNNYNKLNKIIK